MVSIIVPCYKQAHFLSETLESVLNQSYTNWECIIINDGSPDNTEEIAADWIKKDKRFKYLKKTNGGLSSARNAGIMAAKGDFFQFLDSDDLLQSEKLSVQLETFKQNPQFDIIYAPVRYFQTENKKKYYLNSNLEDEEWVYKISGNLDVVFIHLIVDNFFAVNCPLIKRSVVEKVGFFNENLKSHEDYDYWNRAALNGFYFHFEDSILSYALVRVHNQDMSKNLEIMNTTRLIAKGYFLNKLIYEEKFANEYIVSEYRFIKIRMTRLFLSNELDIYLYKPLLNKFGLFKLIFLPIIPKPLKRIFLTLDKYTLYEKYNKFFK